MEVLTLEMLRFLLFEFLFEIFFGLLLNISLSLSIRFLLRISFIGIEQVKSF